MSTLSLCIVCVRSRQTERLRLEGKGKRSSAQTSRQNTCAVFDTAKENVADWPCTVLRSMHLATATVGELTTLARGVVVRTGGGGSLGCFQQRPPCAQCCGGWAMIALL